jgi:D-arabinose 1-dehydrogenase
LQTDYLDVVYLHDVEFVCMLKAPRTIGKATGALAEEKAAYGLQEGDEGKILGPGDQTVLDAIRELWKLKEEGLVKNVGISGSFSSLYLKGGCTFAAGYPLPSLLRIALLVLHNPPYQPLDAILSYCHLTLQNRTLSTFLPAFQSRARVGQVLAASPLAMGLLSTPHTPSWHPAPILLRAAAAQALGVVEDIPNLAHAFSLRRAGELCVPVVAGLSSMKEVHAFMKVVREVQERKERLEDEKKVQDLFEKAGYLDWSWASPM